MTTPKPPAKPNPAPLTKALLYRLEDGPPPGKGKPQQVKIKGDPVAVQFNPTSLRISRQNNVDTGGATTGTQRRQNPSQRSATLTFDLEFDTAEGDQNGEPLDVRTLTLQVRQFVEPDKSKPADPSPRVLFLWGTLAFAGIITQLTEDLDYFSRDGMALRAKLGVTISEQNLAFEANKEGAGARKATGTTPPGGGSANSGPGSSGTSNPVQVALAQAGESIQQVLSRLDQDPSAWRSAMNGIGSPLSLAAGAQVQLSASASAGAGIGVSAGFAASASAGVTAGAGAVGGTSAVLSAGAAAGAAAVVSAGAAASASAGASAGAAAGVSADATAAFTAGADVDVVATAGASATAGAFAGASASMAAGFALAVGGGVGATYNRAVGAQVDAAVGSARASFDVPAASTGLAVQAGASVAASSTPSGAGLAAGPTQVGGTAPAGTAASGTTSSQQPCGAVMPVDSRAVSFGRGIPLSVRADADTVTGSQAGGQFVIGARAPTSEISLPASPLAPSWQQPPA